MNPISTNGAPCPERRDDVYFIEPIEAKQRIKALIYSPCVWGVWTHFEKETTPCYRNERHCVNGHDPSTLRWKGYVLGMNYFRHKITFFQITKALVYHWHEGLASGVTLRGQMVYFSRGAKRNSPQRIEVDQYETKPPDGLPRDCDPRASIYNMLKMDDPGHPWALAPILKLRDMDATG